MQLGATKQYQSLQAGRALASLLVVVHHAALAVGIFKGLWQRPAVFYSLRGLAFGVEFFFVLSGIVILMAHMRDLGKLERAKLYVWKRFRRIYPIYWFVCVAWLAFYLGFASHPDPTTTRFLTLLSSFALVHIGTFDSLIGVSWTLFHEVLFYLVFVFAIANRRVGMWVFALWMAGSVVVPAMSHSPWLTNYFCSPLHLLFLYGMAVFFFVANRPPFFPGVCACVGLILFGMSMILGARYGFEAVWLQQLAGISAAVMLYGSMLLELHGRLSFPPLLIYFGDASYSIYLAHMPVLYFISKPLYKASSSLHLGVFACMAILFLLGTVAGCLCHSCVEAPLMRLLGSGGSKHYPQAA